MHNLDITWKYQKSSSVLNFISTQIRQHFGSNLYQFIWIQFRFLNASVLQ